MKINTVKPHCVAPLCHQTLLSQCTNLEQIFCLLCILTLNQPSAALVHFAIQQIISTPEQDLGNNIYGFSIHLFVRWNIFFKYLRGQNQEINTDHLFIFNSMMHSQQNGSNDMIQHEQSQATSLRKTAMNHQQSTVKVNQS